MPEVRAQCRTIRLGAWFLPLTARKRCGAKRGSQKRRRTPRSPPAALLLLDLRGWTPGSRLPPFAPLLRYRMQADRAPPPVSPILRSESRGKAPSLAVMMRRRSSVSCLIPQCWLCCLRFFNGWLNGYSRCHLQGMLIHLPWRRRGQSAPTRRRAVTMGREEAPFLKMFRPPARAGGRICSTLHPRGRAGHFGGSDGTPRSSKRVGLHGIGALTSHPPGTDPGPLGRGGA